MDEIISQEEVSKLYSKAVVDQFQKHVKAEHKEHNVLKYNFQRPTRFNKDQMRSIQMIHETFSGLIHNLFSSYLRSTVTINLIAVDQLIYSEYISSIGNPSHINIINMEPLKGEAILEINQSLVFAFIDRLLGGMGFTYDKVREFTEIEKNIMKKIVDEILLALENAWKHVIDLKTKIKKLETNPQFVQIVSPEETVILITFEVKIEDISGLITICLPYPLLESIQMKLNSKNWFAFKGRMTMPARDPEMEKKIHNVKLELQAFLGTILVKTRDILNLKEGDIIKLDTNVNNLIRIDVEGLPKFFAYPGILNSKNSIKIQKVISNDERMECHG